MQAKQLALLVYGRMFRMFQGCIAIMPLLYSSHIIHTYGGSSLLKLQGQQT